MEVEATIVRATAKSDKKTLTITFVVSARQMADLVPEEASFTVARLALPYLRRWKTMVVTPVGTKIPLDDTLTDGDLDRQELEHALDQPQHHKDLQ